MSSDEREFGANVQDSYSEGTNLIISYDIYGNEWDRDSFCSTFPTAPALTTGSVDSNLCFTYDSVEYTMAFNPITYPSCSDTGVIITYEVDISSTSL